MTVTYHDGTALMTGASFLDAMVTRSPFAGYER